MKPELVVQDFGGAHSADIDRSFARLMKGGSWKKQRIIVVLPSAATIPAKVALSHWNLAFPPNQAVVRILALGDEVGVAYSQAIEAILAHPELSQWEYVLTIEHDNCPPSDGVVRLIEGLQDRPEICALSGLYATKGEGGVFQCWGDVRDPIINFRPQLPPKADEILQVYGIGMGFALWRLSHFKEHYKARPFFQTKCSKEGVGTQDLAHAGEALKVGCKFGVAGSVRVGHYDLEGKFGIPDFMW